MTATSPCLLVATVLAAPVLSGGTVFHAQTPEAPSCQSSIVSSSVVATYCGHRVGDDEVLDLLILWRGRAGWFQRREPGGGGGGSRTFGAGTKGRVSQQESYGDVVIAFAADFDGQTVTIGRLAVSLDHINTIVVDEVDGGSTVTARRWTEPRTRLGGDVNLALARRSRQLRTDLRCQIPMPAPKTRVPVLQPRVVTVCERLNAR